jgi:3-methyladenine DNA glycosylase AlkC
VAEPLKNRYGPEIPHRIAAMIGAVFPGFAREAFIHDALDGYEALNLMQRGKKISQALRRHLPGKYPRAIRILLASAGTPLEKTEGHGMTPFLYLPHLCYVAEYGLDHFEPSMHAQYELTQRFTAEFSIRPFLERHPAKTLALLRQWVRDPSPHLRRLVSEGTRPRLPWAPRLRAFQKDPRPVLRLLELLKDDPEIYVRRSVANNLNDIGKDHPELLVATAKRWLKGASEARRRLVRHALRSAVKRCVPGALEVLGFGVRATVSTVRSSIAPRRASIGGKVTILSTKAAGNRTYWRTCGSTSSRPAEKTRRRFSSSSRLHFFRANACVSSKPFHWPI